MNRVLVIIALFFCVVAQAQILTEQSTAGQYIPVRMLSATDHLTPVTSITSPTITLMKAGAGMTSIHDGTWIEGAAGAYQVRLDATDTDTLGPLVIRVVKAGCDDALALADVRVSVPTAVWSANTRSITGGTVDSLPAVTLATNQPNYAPAKAGDSMVASNFVAAPEASTVATSVWSANTRSITGGTVDSLPAVTLATNQPNYAPAKAGDVMGTTLVQRSEPDNVSISSIKTVTDHLATTLEAHNTVYRFSEDALYLAPSGGGGGSCDPGEIVTAMQETGTMLSDLWLRPTASGSGRSMVDHNTGGTDAMRVMTRTGIGIGGVTITAYIKSEYDAGSYIARATTETKDDGRWLYPLGLNAGIPYKLLLQKTGVYGPKIVEVTPN